MSLGSLQETLLIYMFKLKKEKEQIIILPVSTHCYLFTKRIASPKNWPSVLRSQVMTMSQIWIVTQKSDILNIFIQDDLVSAKVSAVINEGPVNILNYKITKRINIKYRGKLRLLQLKDKKCSFNVVLKSNIEFFCQFKHFTNTQTIVSIFTIFISTLIYSE